jgi:hypothetical protein
MCVYGQSRSERQKLVIQRDLPAAILNKNCFTNHVTVKPLAHHQLPAKHYDGHTHTVKAKPSKNTQKVGVTYFVPISRM